MTHPISEKKMDVAALLESVETFAKESNRIEGIARTTPAHVDAHIEFLDGPITIPKLIEFVSVNQPGAVFRNQPNVPGVRVGNHVAPASGPDIETQLRKILAMRDPWAQHVAYETLHPFTDGNGRSGRAIWLHRHFHEPALDPWAIRRGFLHSFYYQTLGGSRADYPTLTKKVDELEAVASRAEAWLRECSDWLLEAGLDMACSMQTDPLDIADGIRTALNDTTQCRESDNG